MIQKNHQTQQDNNMLDYKYDFISTNQHAHQQEAAISKQAQTLWAVSWKLSFHAVLQVSKIWAHSSSLLLKSEVWFLYDIKTW